MLQKSSRGASAPLRSDDANHPMATRRFPAPWTVEETDACFIVKDHAGQSLAYVYFEEEPGWRAATRLMMRDEARRMADRKGIDSDPYRRGIVFGVVGRRGGRHVRKPH
jgi:hypothetical protein